MRTVSRGFTLIELVVVISILGILAAFALPRFAALQTEARIAKMNAGLGAIKAAAALAHSLQLTQQLAGNQPVLIEGASIPMINGYPTAATTSIGYAAGLTDAAGAAVDEYVVSATATVFTARPDATRTNCAVRYTRALAGAAPIYDKSGLTAANCQ